MLGPFNDHRATWLQAVLGQVARGIDPATAAVNADKGRRLARAAAGAAARMMRGPPRPAPPPTLQSRNGRRVVEVVTWNPGSDRFDVYWFELMNPCTLPDGTQLERVAGTPGSWTHDVRTRRRAIINPAGTQ